MGLIENDLGCRLRASLLSKLIGSESADGDHFSDYLCHVHHCLHSLPFRFAEFLHPLCFLVRDDVVPVAFIAELPQLGDVQETIGELLPKGPPTLMMIKKTSVILCPGEDLYEGVLG